MVRTSKLSLLHSGHYDLLVTTLLSFEAERHPFKAIPYAMNMPNEYTQLTVQFQSKTYHKEIKVFRLHPSTVIALIVTFHGLHLNLHREHN